MIARPTAAALSTALSVAFLSTSDSNPLDPVTWDNGAAVGVDWKNFQASGGIACAGAFSSDPAPPYNDAIAILRRSAFTCAADQAVEWVVHRAPGYGPVATHEVGVFLRFTLTANVAAGYEAYLGHSANFSIVRWNGAVNDFTPLSWTGAGPVSPVHGDVNRFTAEGSTLRYYQNNVLVATATDTTFATGQPGLQSYATVGATLTSYGMSSARLGKL